MVTPRKHPKIEYVKPLTVSAWLREQLEKDPTANAKVLQGEALEKFGKTRMIANNLAPLVTRMRRKVLAEKARLAGLKKASTEKRLALTASEAATKK